MDMEVKPKQPSTYLQRLKRAERILRDKGPLTAPELAEAMGVLHPAAMRYLEVLTEQKRAKCTGQEGRASVWTWLPPSDSQRVGPAYRGPVGGKPFKGVDWSTSLLRPGCQDHLLHPSRRGDEYVPHMPPINGCVGDLRDRTSAARD